MILPLIATMLSGCVGTKHYDAKEYMMTVNWKNRASEDFKILQLSDVHLSQSDTHEEHFAVIDKTIKTSKPNLIVLNGDIFTFADKHVVNKFFKFIDSHKIPWTFTFGNHDDQGYYADTYIPRLMSDKEKFQFSYMKNLENDDVTGRTNFVINLKDDATNKIVHQVYVLDSHSYNFETMRYDALKQDQLDWYKRVVNYSIKHFGGGAPVLSSMYLHIALPEALEPWDQSKDEKHQENLIIGDMEEWGGSPKKDPGFFETIRKLNSTKSIHAAHEHANDSVMLYKGVYICFGVHSTNRIYNDENEVKFGGQVIKIDKDGGLTFKNYYVDYDSLKVHETEGWQK